MLYFSILVPLPAECSESVPSCNVSFAYTFVKISAFRNYLKRDNFTKEGLWQECMEEIFIQIRYSWISP